MLTIPMSMNGQEWRKSPTNLRIGKERALPQIRLYRHADRQPLLNLDILFDLYGGRSKCEKTLRKVLKTLNL